MIDRAEPKASSDVPKGQWGRRPVTTLLFAFTVYIALSVLLWWHAWSTHPAGVAACACNDPSLFVWFLEWPAYAIAHGHNPFYSSSLFYPRGINLVSNTGVLTLGIPLAPVTWIFGPVATLNVASTLGPALSALSMYWLLSWWTRWAPAAFTGGLVFGFSPFALTNLAVAHLNTEVLALVPLMVACLDEIFVRHKRGAVVAGGALGMLVTLQFFLGTEMLVIVAVCAVAGIAMLLGFAGIFRRDELACRLPHVLRAFGWAGTVAGLLLAYPLWFAFAGPAHLSGLIWPSTTPGLRGIHIGNIWNLHFTSAPAVRLFAGYEGPALPQGEYLGVGMLIVLAIGTVAWRRERLLWLFGALGVLSTALSLGVTHQYWVPWRALAHIPLIQNVTAARFFAVTTLCAAVMLGIVVDRTHHFVVKRARTSKVPPKILAGAAAAISIGISAVAVVPMGSAIATNVPFTTESMSLPAWFTAVAPHLAPGQVVLTFPPPVAGGAALTWQAMDSLHFPMATGAGPESIPERAGRERAGLAVLTQASVVLSPLPPATRRNLEAVRQALDGWRVTVVVVPDPSALFPRYDRSASTAWALGAFTLAIGRQPSYQQHAWVWRDVQSPSLMLSVTLKTFARCTAADVYKSAPQAVAKCVMGSVGNP